MEQLLVGLLLWISQHSEFEYKQEMVLPTIEQVSSLELAALYIGKDNKAQGYLTQDDKSDVYQNLAANLEAFYDPELNIIYLGEKIALESDYGRAVIVHELVHFLQKTHNHRAKVDCKNALEKDAYFIQEAYMKAHNLTPSFNGFTVLTRSLCGHPY